jgi:outer membrane receptor protein involved in Fe transport
VTAPKPRPRAPNRLHRVEATPTRVPTSRPTATPSVSVAAPSGPTATQQAGSPGAQAAQAIQRPPGEPITTIDRDRFKDAPDFSIGDVLEDSPGISIKQGNGPRDVGISIRGSNAQNGFGIRNLVMLEDGFPVMQPDGLSRSDLTDPHAYSAIDVYRGPSSPLYGNFATSGAINFLTRTGQDIDGFQYGSEAGSFGYLNNYLALGHVVGPAQYSLFASDVRGDGFIANSEFSTQTVNFLGIVAPSSNDRIITKFVENYVGTELAIRLSLAQFQRNPFQKGCTVALNAAPGCATVSLFANGKSGATVPELPGWRYTAVYTYDNQIYTDFIEQLSAGQFTARFNRAGDFIPGVSPNELLTRLGYDQPSGAWKGLGGFIELAWQGTYYMDNANLLKANGYELVNLNLHYNTDLADPYIKSVRVFFEIKNLFDKTYVASANNISDTISAATGFENPGSILATTGTGSIYTGSPRAFIGGMTLAFR